MIQGPFELDELVSLHAFSEELLVCMEDREEWLPVGRIADLAESVEQQKIRRATPIAPAPPPPTRPSTTTPLQGEFFSELPGQQSLLPPDDESKGPYAYRPDLGELETPLSYFQGQPTMPFHFMQQPQSRAGVLEMPRRLTEKKPFFMRTAFKESPVRKIQPIPEEKIEPKPTVSLRLLQDEPTESLPEVLAPEAPEQDTSKPSVLPSLTSPYEEQSGSGRKLELLPWIMGVALAVSLLGVAGYWVMDKVSNRSAITEANRLESPTPVSLPASTPLPAPKVDIADQTIPPAVAPTPVQPIKKRSYVRAARRKIHSAMRSLKNGQSALTKATSSSVSSGAQKIKTILPIIKNVITSWGHRLALALSSLKKTKMVTVSAPEISPEVPSVKVPAASAGVPRHLQVSKGKKVNTKKQIPHAKGHPGKPHATQKKPLQASAQPEVQAPSQEPPEPAQEAAAPSVSPPAVHLPGLGTPVVQKPAVADVPAADVPAADVPAPNSSKATDPWAERQSDAIKLVVAKTLPNSQVTIGNQAKAMLKQMHEKELMHAAETGERLYLPDKMAWAALQEEGARYRVYLNFQAMQANGERVQARSYQFIVDLKTKAIRADDPATEQDLMTQNVELNFKHNPMATDIDSILGGVDTYNKHKVQMIIIKKNRSNRAERAKIEAAEKAAEGKVQRAVIYFRRTYPDKALQNVAKAYNFMDVVNGK